MPEDMSGYPLRMMSKRVVRLALIIAVSIHIFSADTPSAPAEQAFRKIQNLAGKWTGKDEQGHMVKTDFAPVAANTAMMETLTMPGMEDMLTLYSIDINSIALVHYCPTNNQPRMRAVVSATPVKELVFGFSGAGNLPDPKVGHEHKLVLQFIDQDHITEHWTWRRNGNDAEMVFRFARLSREQK